MLAQAPDVATVPPSLIAATGTATLGPFLVDPLKVNAMPHSGLRPRAHEVMQPANANEPVTGQV